MRKSKNKIVTIGGGTGSSQVLLGLKDYPVQLSAIVSMMDSGGSTGKLARDLKVHPMGDIRQVLLSLSNTDPSRKDFFNRRLTEGDLKGHNVGNMLLAALEKISGNFNRAIEIAKKFLNTKGEVIPVTLEKTDLVAYLENGKKLVKEDSLDLLRQRKYVFKKLGLTKKVKANSKAIKVIKEAQFIVICPGNPLRSILPNFLVSGIKQAIKRSKAKVILIMNLMNKKGQTNHMTFSQVVSFYEKYIGKGVIDFVVYNTARFEKNFLKKYQLADESLIATDKDNLSQTRYKAVGSDLLSKQGFRQKRGDVLLKRTAIRHDSKKLAKIIMRIVYS